MNVEEHPQFRKAVRYGWTPLFTYTETYLVCVDPGSLRTPVGVWDLDDFAGRLDDGYSKPRIPAPDLETIKALAQLHR